MRNVAQECHPPADHDVLRQLPCPSKDTPPKWATGAEVEAEETEKARVRAEKEARKVAKAQAKAENKRPGRPGCREGG